MSHYMFIRHKVRDFAEWKPGYEAHLAKRKEAGLTEKFLMREADDPNEIVVLFEAKDLARAQQFAESDDLRKTMQELGVIDTPEIHFLNS